MLERDASVDYVAIFSRSTAMLNAFSWLHSELAKVVIDVPVHQPTPLPVRQRSEWKIDGMLSPSGSRNGYETAFGVTQVRVQGTRSRRSMGMGSPVFSQMPNRSGSS